MGLRKRQILHRPIPPHNHPVKMDKYKKLNPKNYDHLWEFQGGTYLVCSVYVGIYSDNFKKDFICSSINNDRHSLYISKSERKKASEEGFKFYYGRFNDYEKRVKKQIKFSKKLFGAVKARDFSKMSDKQLVKDFEKTLKYNIIPWKDYYCLDYFSTDKVSAVMDSNDKRYDLKLLEKNMKKMGHLKFLQRSTLNETMYRGGALDKYRKEINKRLNLPYDASHYSWQELIELLRGKKIKIPDRSIWIKGKFSKGKDILGKDAEKIIKNLSAAPGSITEIKGNIGNKGHYIGKVKKIEMDTKKHNYSEDIDKMEKGDVLVSGTTGPELILACRKAGAIITEEGGIISHAAIVSRELGIPSIIGTKIATKVLKDGDVVEVDANNGVVRILKRYGGK